MISATQSPRFRIRNTARALAILLGSVALVGTVPQTAPAPPASINARLTGDLSPVHDPAIIKQDGVYYLFTTTQEKDGGGLIHIRSSTDLVTWKRSGAVFDRMPDWTKQTVPGTVGIWAPDVAKVGDRYRVYYSISTFGKNRSAIGLATNATLDPASPDYAWRDEGVVFTSDSGDDFNAIDPNLFVDDDGSQWMSFGSFWSGIKLFRIDPATGKRAAGDDQLHAIARRPSPGAVEAPFIVKRDGWYYQFVSFDFCCRGAKSTYFTVVGRSKAIIGPYLDYKGRSMTKGGGLVALHASLDDSKRFVGPGHVAILRDGARDYIVHHAYDTTKDGAPTLRIQPLGWTPDGWPVAL